MPFLVLPKNHTETDLERFQCDCEQTTKEAQSVARVPDADSPQPTVDRGNQPLDSEEVVFEDICLNSAMLSENVANGMDPKGLVRSTYNVNPADMMPAEEEQQHNCSLS